MMNPVKDMKMTDLEFVERVQAEERLTEQAASSKCASCPHLPGQYAAFEKQVAFLPNDRPHLSLGCPLQMIRLGFQYGIETGLSSYCSLSFL